MKEIYLTVKQLAEVKGCTERYIRNCITKRKIEAIQIEGQVGGNAGTHYSIPLSKLDEKVQLKYKRYLKKLQKEAEKQTQEQKEKKKMQYFGVSYWKVGRATEEKKRTKKKLIMNL